VSTSVNLPLNYTSVKSRSSLLAPAHLGGPGERAQNGCGGGSGAIYKRHFALNTSRVGLGEMSTRGETHTLHFKAAIRLKSDPLFYLNLGVC